MQNRKLLGNLLLVLTAFVWGMAFAFQRSGAELVPAFTFGMCRMLLAAVSVGILVTVLDIKDGKLRDRKTGRFQTEEAGNYGKNTIKGGVLCGLFLASAGSLQQLGLSYTTAGKSGFLTALYMLCVPIISLLLFRKKTGLRIWAAVVIAVIGMYFLCMSSGSTFSRGDLYTIFCAVLFSGQILSADYFVGKVNTVKMSAIQFLTASIIDGCLAFAFESPDFGAVFGPALVSILYCGVISGGVGYTLQLVAQGFTEPTVASILMSLESVFAAIGGALVLHEYMSAREILGCIIMFAAIILVQLPTRIRKDS